MTTIFTEMHSTEKGTFAPRPPKTKIDMIVVHYTATTELSRTIPAAHAVRLLTRAIENKGVDPKSPGVNELFVRFQDPKNVCSDALALCMIAASRPERTASWHYCIASKRIYIDGTEANADEVVEFVDPDMQAHHVGKLGLRTNVRSIGIECVYPGPASKRALGLNHKPTEQEATMWYRQRGWNRPPTYMQGPDGVRNWFTQPDPLQVENLTEVVKTLCMLYPTIKYVASHYRFSPKNRIDPDPPFNLESLRQRVSFRVGREIIDYPR